MPSVLLDSHLLLWIAEDAAISAGAEIAIAKAAERNTLFASPISAWEIGVAATKPNLSRRPALNGLEPEEWFKQSVEALRLQLTPMSLEIALEAARLPAMYGSGDPGDCFLIATAHVLGLTLITRDSRILNFAEATPNYLTALRG